MRLCYNEKRKVSFEEIKNYVENHLEEINRQNDLGFTASILVISHNRKDAYEIVKLLLEKGANPNLETKHQSTALIFASNLQDYNHKLVKLLLNYGACPNHKNTFGQVPLFGLSYPRSNIKSIKLLLKRGANPNIQNYNGNSCLTIIQKYCPSYRTTKILLDYGANPQLKNNDGETALKIVHRNGPIHRETIKLLRKHNLKKLNIKNRQLKKKNNLLREMLNLYEEGPHILELMKSVLDHKY
jgi:ankyrin repeat protein